MKSRLLWSGCILLVAVGCTDVDPITTSATDTDGSATGTTDGTPPPGSETQPCVESECLGELVCLSNVCVDNSPLTSSPSTDSPDPDTSTTAPDTGTTAGSVDTTDTTTDPVGATGTTTDADTTGTTDAPDTGTTTDPETTAGACMHLEVARAPAAIVVLVDKSGSMKTEDFNHDGVNMTPAISPYTGLRKELLEVLDEYGPTTQIGMGLYPSKDAGGLANAAACLNNDFLETPIAYDNAAEIAEDLPLTADDFKGSGPVAKSLAAALGELAEVPETTARSIILISDTAASCSMDAEGIDLFEKYDSSVELTVELAWKNMHVATHVIGVQIADVFSGEALDTIPDNINQHDRFNALAVAGGYPRDGGTKYWPVVKDDDYTAAFKATFAAAQGCHLALDQPPADPDATVVTVGGIAYPYDPAAECELKNGWEWIDEDHTTLRLCGNACEALNEAGEALVDVDC